MSNKFNVHKTTFLDSSSHEDIYHWHHHQYCCPVMVVVKKIRDILTSHNELTRIHMTRLVLIWPLAQEFNTPAKPGCAFQCGINLHYVKINIMVVLFPFRGVLAPFLAWSYPPLVAVPWHRLYWPCTKLAATKAASCADGVLMLLVLILAWEGRFLNDDYCKQLNCI